MTQKSIFGDEREPAQDSDGSADADTPRWFVVSNRSNVLEYLSSDLLLPRAAFEKYYSDVLELAHGVVPLISGPVDEDLVALAGSELGNFVVLVEVDPAVVQPSLHVQVGFVPLGTLDSVRALHFREPDDSQEFEARPFDNVAHDRVPYRVSPELFGHGLTRLDVERALTEVGMGPRPFSRCDRIGAARALALRAAPPTDADLDAVARLVLGPTRKRGRKKAKEPQDWLALDAELEQYRPLKNATLDERLFRAAAEVFIAAERQDATSPSEVLQAVSARLDADNDLGVKDVQRWSSARRWIESLLSGDAAFTTFKSSQYKTEKALLLALVRSRPHEVLSWADEDINAHPYELTVAAALVGLAQGRKTLPTELRPRQLDRWLARREASELLDKPWSPPALAVVTRTEDGVAQLVLTADDTALLQLDRAPPSLQALLQTLPATDAINSALVDLADEQGWTDAVKSTIRFNGPFEVRPARSSIELDVIGPLDITRQVDRQALEAHLGRGDDAMVRTRLSQLAAPPDDAGTGPADAEPPAS